MEEEGEDAHPGPLWRDAILESIADGVFTVDEEWRITYFNRAAEEITGVDRGAALGRRCHEVFKADNCERNCCLRRTLESGEPATGKTAHIVRSDGERLRISISTAVLRDRAGRIAGGVETFRSLRVVEALRKRLDRRFSFADIITKNKGMHELLGIVPRLAESDASVLLVGESGTGKELFARAIHSSSRRRLEPWIAVNCAALPDTLLESELFGHLAGAFTDARSDRPGRFALADGGTIFLDEIGDVSPALQVRLLRVLQEKTIEPLGGTEPRKVDVRVIAATHTDLEELVHQGKFRIDLFYRLDVIKLTIPPLRERREDIPLLVEHFIDHFNDAQGKQISHIDPPALALLMRHPFEGNVRELKNVVEHAFVLCTGEILRVEHLPEHLQEEAERGAVRPEGALRRAEAEVIREALTRLDFNRAAVARELGMHKTTLWRKMKKLGIEAP